MWIVAGGVVAACGYAIYRVRRSLEVEAPTETGSALTFHFGIEFCDKSLRDMLDIAEEEGLYVQWNPPAMTVGEIAHLKAQMREMQGICARADALAKEGKRHPVVDRLTATADGELATACKVAAFGAATWTPDADDSLELRSRDAVMRDMFRAAACVYYHPKIHSRGFDATFEEALPSIAGVV